MQRNIVYCTVVYLTQEPKYSTECIRTYTVASATTLTKKPFDLISLCYRLKSKYLVTFLSVSSHSGQVKKKSSSKNRFEKVDFSFIKLKLSKVTVFCRVGWILHKIVWGPKKVFSSFRVHWEPNQKLCGEKARKRKTENKIKNNHTWQITQTIIW